MRPGRPRLDLATCPNPTYRDGKKAVEIAIEACELTRWKEAYCLETLAAAYAESGDFANAVKWQIKAIELEADPKEKEDYRARLKLFQERSRIARQSPDQRLTPRPIKWATDAGGGVGKAFWPEPFRVAQNVGLKLTYIIVRGMQVSHHPDDGKIDFTRRPK